MEGYDASTYGELIADVYDTLYHVPAEAGACADLLAELAGDGPALELAIGTGRVALPLADRGVPVHGIDASPAMVAQLRTKPGGAEIPVTIGDFADVAVDGSFRLVYVVFNTFFALVSQPEQVRCFRNVAAHLAGDGVFVVDAFVPDLSRYVRGQHAAVTRVDLDEVHIDLSRHDQATQTVDASHVRLSAGGVRLLPVRLRYAWPSELDLMAQLVGLRLRDRWAGWRREPFTSAAVRHVSVYGA